MKINSLLLRIVFLLFINVLFTNSIQAQEKSSDQNWPDRTVLPIEPYQKVGKVAPTIKDSDPIEWPKEISAPEGAPNVFGLATKSRTNFLRPMLHFLFYKILVPFL
ncbi:hypothetical protein CLU81_3894 [Flavobacterium sp. 9]|uniref:hypothetical protein n=1 Tax=Flavobacterium sp. 9 TaxID=2035198 RepID=UPI000C18D662|nr:hypothetical protein [Flavobacterium sp. 9]PIF33297.1 hypothetical protein CLU81_3894 [Flavobacterium sp. 9]